MCFSIDFRPLIVLSNIISIYLILQPEVMSTDFSDLLLDMIMLPNENFSFIIFPHLKTSSRFDMSFKA
ncbi:hypothetical protein T10_8165 [Trichinella papuae]|uniref:Uncharacterized protein n=1 Tax=Trichinella papuae TaxID=268474 RepID=A0A0V1MZH3_9BILA|nr:hypothetical protein T10_8165 [Trichinella papuae]